MTVIDMLIGGLGTVDRFRASAPVAGDQAAIDREILLGHAARREALLEAGAYARTRQLRELVPDGGHRSGFAVDDQPGHAMFDDLGYRAAAEGDHRCAASHCLDHHQAERLGPVDWHE